MARACVLFREIGLFIGRDALQPVGGVGLQRNRLASGVQSAGIEAAWCCRRAWISMKTFTSDTAAGVTPGIRLAWPKVRGLTRSSFSCISRERPLTLR